MLLLSLFLKDFLGYLGDFGRIKFKEEIIKIFANILKFGK
jgi:hypothetical protein